VASVVLLAFVLLGGFLITTGKWKEAKGYEYEWIADSLASGHGYSFDVGTAWLGPYENPGGYVPTAWSEPLQVLLLAFAFRTMGESGRLFLVLLNLLWLSLTCLICYLIGRRISGALTGYLSALLFLVIVVVNTAQLVYIGNLALASLLIALCAFALIRVLDDPSVRRIVTLGLALGLAGLAHAGTLLFALVAAGLILFHRGGPRRSGIRNAGILLAVVLLTLSPWIARNYSAFQRVVPVRNGFGWQLYMGNVGLSGVAAYDLGEAFAGPPFPWRAANDRQAVGFFRSIENERKVRHYLMGTAPYPEAYGAYNEAQRDRFFLLEALAFLKTHLLQAGILMFWKAFAFFTWDKLTLIVALLAVAGWLARFRDLRVQGLMLFVIAYALPYIVSIPLYYRYIFPIQSLMVILAAIAVRSLLLLTRRGRNLVESIDSPSLSGVE
jgi:hypothetical protein